MWVASQLNGRVYVAAGQAGGALHTIAVLQAYQVDLLKDLDDGQGLYPEMVSELSRTTELALWASRSAPQTSGDPGPSEDCRQAQRQSIDNPPPPPRRSRMQKRNDQRRAKKDLREVIESKCAGKQLHFRGNILLPLTSLAPSCVIARY